MIAAAAPAALADALAAALPPGAGLDALVPAAAVWAATVRGTNGTAQITVRAAAGDVVITSEGGTLTDVRQRPHGWNDAAVASVDPPWTKQAAALTAAGAVWRARGPLLRTDARRARLDTARRRRRRLTAAGVLALGALAAAGTLARYDRALEQVRAERAVLAPALARALAVRDSLDRVEARIAAAGVAAGASGWSGVLASLSQRLTTDGHIVFLLGAGDSLTLRIDATAAADVLPALRAASLLRNVRIAGAVERDVSVSDRPTERFDIAAQLAAPGGAP